MYKKIVVPLDGSTAAECVLDHVRSVAGKGTEVVLVRVVAKPSYDYLLRESQLSASAQTRLKDAQGVPDSAKTAIVSSLDKGASIGEGSLQVTGAPSEMENTPESEAVGQTIKLSFVDAARAAGLVASLFVLLGAVSSLLIPTTIRRSEPRGTRKGVAHV